MSAREGDESLSSLVKHTIYIYAFHKSSIVGAISVAINIIIFIVVIEADIKAS